MMTLILRRLLALVPTLFLVMTAAFFMMRLAPGSPFAQERALDPKVRANLEAAYGLDKPIHIQYVTYLKGFVRGDLGASAKFKSWTVTEIVRQSFLISLTIGFFALVLAVVMGMSAGVIAATRQNTFIDHAAMSFAMIGVSIPNFVIAPFLVILFSFHLGWLPPGLWGSPSQIILLALVLFDVPLERQSFFDRVQILALQVLDDRQFGDQTIVRFANFGANAMQPSVDGRTQATFTADQLISSVNNPNQNRL